MPQISIIVPVYKVEPYLHSCVDSILVQTFTDFELILVDDGSPDNCPAICDEYAQKDERVRVVHQHNGGLSVARNAGLDIAEGEYIVFIDSDDTIHYQFLEQLYHSTQKNNCDIAMCQFMTFVDNISWHSVETINETCITPIEACFKIYERISDGFIYVAAWGKIYSRKLFKEIRFPQGRLHEDQFVTYRLLYAANKVVVINQPLYGYRNNPTSIMKARFSLKRYDDLDALCEARSFFEDIGEHTIANQVQKRINWTLAVDSFFARKSKLYRKINREYQISVRKATKILVDEWGLNKAEYFIKQFYPNYVKGRSFLRKLKNKILHS